MQIIFRVVKEAKKYKWLLITAALSTLMLTVINLSAPRIMAQMTTLVSEGMTREGLDQIVVLTLILVGLYSGKILFRFMSNYFAHKAAWNLVEELRMKVYRKLQDLSVNYFRNRESGDLVSRTMDDAATFELLYAHLLPESVTNVITVVGVTVILFATNVRLAALTCIPIPFILLSGWFFSKKVRPNFRMMQKSRGVLSAQLQDNFSGMQEIQSFGQQKNAGEKVRKKAAVLTDTMLHALKMSAIFHPTVEFLTALGTVIVVGFGGYLAYLGEINVGDVVAFLLYLSLFYAPITGIAQLLESLQQAIAGAERVIEILDSPESIPDKEDAVVLDTIKGRIELEHVSFSYIDGVPVLDDISFMVEPGQMIAFVGATGAGKSTLAQLLTRFFDPKEGVIRLDGHDLRDIKLSSIRENQAMVLQDTFLFNASIAENIAFARPEASVEEIENAARVARVHEDIMAMPDGYNTRVGERGAKLSGGQKQRIAIARAVLCRAPILILDEATASVDVETEAGIQKAIHELAGTRTIVAIAHRLSTIRNADCIFVLGEGKIVQQGSHDVLAAVPGPYRDMCRIQEEGARGLIIGSEESL